MKAVLEDGSAKADYVTLTIPFKETGNGSFDPTKKKYKLAIVCSSSKKEISLWELMEVNYG